MCERVCAFIERPKPPSRPGDAVMNVGLGGCEGPLPLRGLSNPVAFKPFLEAEELPPGEPDWWRMDGVGVCLPS